MTAIIKNGTIVTADLTYKADVKIEDGNMTEIGPNLMGREGQNATRSAGRPLAINPLQRPL